MKSTIISLFTLCLVLTFAPSASKAQPNPNPPGQISYQGFLTDANGLPLATNNPVNYNVEFRIWNQPSGGSNLWGESQVVTVDRGYFTVLLGNGSSLPGGVPFTNNLAGIFSGIDASDRYVEMTVMGLAPGDPPIQPRLRLLTTPYSFLASSALVANSALSVPDNSLSTNVALRGAANTFTGDQTITGGSIYMDNNTGIFGKDTSGFQEFCLFPRDQADRTLLSYGTGGLYISPTAKPPIMFMDPNGFNVGIRDTSPGFPLSFGAATGDKISLSGDSGNHFGFGIQTAQLQIYTDNSASDVVFGYGRSTSFTETMRIKGNGSVGIGIGTNATTDTFQVIGTIRANNFGFGCRASDHHFNFDWDGSRILAYIDNLSVGTVFGTSDRRLKEDIQPLANAALDRVMALKPSMFKYKEVPGSVFHGDGQVNEGFIADELQQVIPSAVNGDKDALTKDGQIQPQTLNIIPVVSVLTKAMQEQQQTIQQQQRAIQEEERAIQGLNQILKQRLEQKETEIAELKARLEKLEELPDHNSNRAAR
jgi:hypothetical protein